MPEAHPTPIRLSPAVADAHAGGRPVVALESTLIAQGLPWPLNLETARAAEAAVRDAGAVPATLAVLAGTVQVGLEDHDLAQIARSGQFAKASTRDLAAAVAHKANAATTVAATLWIARQAGIRVMATGGLGGVHRLAAQSFDVSADLDALAQADGVLVVCSGVKSILDIPATLEALETRGVTVLGYQTDTFPAFTSRCSGLPLETRCDSPAQAAAIVQAHRDLGLPGALVLARPVDPEAALDAHRMETVLQAALDEAARSGIAGKQVTPFLLERIRAGTAGDSLRANTTLIVANARLAAEIAVALVGGR